MSRSVTITIPDSICSLCEKDALLTQCREAFAKHFEAPDRGPFYFAVAPGRIYLIGEHAEFCNDRALAMTVPFYTMVYGRLKKSARRSTLVYYCSTKQLYEIERPYKLEEQLYEWYWAKIVRSVLALHPFSTDLDIVIATSMPYGINMGQAAAFELCIYALLSRLSGPYVSSNRLRVLGKECIELCLKAEKFYSKVRLGKVDLMVTAAAESNCIVLVDSVPCRTKCHTNMEAVNIPIYGISDVAFVLMDSGVRCINVMGEINARWIELEDVARSLQLTDWKEVREEDLRKRLDGKKLDYALHILNEIRRAEEAANALLDNNYCILGRILTASHASLRDLFQVSNRKLDELVKLSLEVDGVFGSRSTGYGFAGFVVTLVARKNILDLVNHVKRNYCGDVTFRDCISGEGVNIFNIVS